MQQILDEITKNWAALQPVLGIVLTLMVMCVGAGFAAGRFFLDQTVRNLDSALKLADRQLADYRAKLDGASPDEVKDKLARLEQTVSELTPFELSAEQAASARKALADYKPARVMFATHLAGTEFVKLSLQLRALLTGQGWVVTDAILYEMGPAPTGIALYVNTHAHMEDHGRAMKAMLDAAGIDFAIYKFPDEQPEKLPQICFAHRS